MSIISSEQIRNSSSPKRVHFINRITIISKEDELKETWIVEPNATKENDHDTIVEEVEEVGEWMEYEEPIDLVDTCDESVYESLIEEMPSCSLNLDFRIQKGDRSNLKILKHEPRHGTILENMEANIDPSVSQVVFSRPFVEMTKLILDREQGLIIFMDRIKEVTIKTSYNDPEMDDLTSEGHYLLSSRVVLSEDDYRRGCERASDLESRFYIDMDKLDPSYKEETDRINLDGSL
ncbi:hypothetical protein Tco_1357746 [Tanacetum coccineum]